MGSREVLLAQLTTSIKGPQQRLEHEERPLPRGADVVKAEIFQLQEKGRLTLRERDGLAAVTARLGGKSWLQLPSGLSPALGWLVEGEWTLDELTNADGRKK